ncbi:MAG: HAD family phosphatase [Chloroflexi bacterium]|nr:HAD family phosphatase [Chloroflexota bacterium]
MTNPIQAIIFDFGGVLIEWDPRNLYRQCFQTPEQMERFLTDVNFSQWNLQFDKGVPFAEGIAELSAQFPHYATYIHALGTRWEETLGDSIRGAVDILRELQRAGYPLYALSNWSAETFPIARRKFDFFDAFREIVLSGEVKMIKPERGIFELMLQKIGRPAHECLFIDDAQANVEAARALGITSILFHSPDELEMDLKALKIL